MSPVRKLEIKVGLLVLLATIATISLILAADKIRFERTYRLDAWLKDAGGLRERSPVTLAGIAVGSVESLSRDPASGRIRAVLSINASIDLPADARARLATSGLFGDSSLALSSRGGGGANLPKDGSGRIEVSPGFFEEAGSRAERIMDAAEDLLSAEARADAKRLLKSSADLAQHAAGVAARLDRQGERIDSLLANLDGTLKDLRETGAVLARQTGPLIEHVDGAVVRLDQRSGELARQAGGVLVRLDALLADGAPRAMAALDTVRDLGGRLAVLSAHIESGEGVLGQLVVSRDLARAVNRVAVDVEAAAKAVADRPSVLVFDDADSRRRGDEARRNRDKMRRTLDEGLAPAAPPAPATGADPR